MTVAVKYSIYLVICRKQNKRILIIKPNKINNPYGSSLGISVYRAKLAIS